jgi:hypothetical protein
VLQSGPRYREDDIDRSDPRALAFFQNFRIITDDSAEASSVREAFDEFYAAIDAWAKARVI